MNRFCMTRNTTDRVRLIAWGRQGSNLRPTDYESAALTD